MKNLWFLFSAVCLIGFASCTGSSTGTSDTTTGPTTGKAYTVKVATDALPSNTSQTMKDVFGSAVSAMFTNSTVSIGLGNNQTQSAYYAADSATSVTITIGGVSLKCDVSISGDVLSITKCTTQTFTGGGSSGISPTGVNVDAAFIGKWCATSGDFVFSEMDISSDGSYLFYYWFPSDPENMEISRSSSADLYFGVYTPWDSICPGLEWKLTAVSSTKITASCSTYRVGYFEKGSADVECATVKPVTTHPISDIPTADQL